MHQICCLFLLLVLSQNWAFSQEKELTAKFDQYIRPYVETNNFSGSVLVSKKGKILFNKAYGVANLEFAVPNDVNTVYHLASISKTFTAAAILMLEEKGLVATEDPLSKYIPDYPLGNKITIHHLLSHTSGIPDINDLPEYAVASLQPQTAQTLVAMIKNQPSVSRPGEKYLYSSANYALLALIIEQVSRMTYGNFLKENIFKPLGMNQSYHHGDMTQIIDKMAECYSTDGNFGLKKSPYLDWSSKTGGGSMATTAGDLAKWNNAVFGTAVLSEKSKQKMFTEYAESGYGWYIGKQFDKNYIFMNGRSPGVCTHMGRYPEEEILVIVLSNTGVFIPKKIAVDLAGILFNTPVEIPALNRKLTPEESMQIVGKYQFGPDFYKSNLTMDVRLSGGKLTSNYGELIPNKPFQFFQRTYWLSVGFNKDAAGKITEMIIDGYRGKKLE